MDPILLWIFSRFVILMAVALIADGLLDWIDRRDAANRNKVSNAWKERRVMYVRK